ncbi:MAG: hypothetical protein AAFQ37_08595 [Bacteroidota bacterium]
MLNLPAHARVWVYPAHRPLNKEEAVQATTAAKAFTEQWTAHNHLLKADAIVLHQQFLILAVDESAAGASGCSIDSSVHFVRQLGVELGVDFFDRMRFSYRHRGDKIVTSSREDFKSAYSTGEINDQTIVFDPLVKTAGDLVEQFERP